MQRLGFEFYILTLAHELICTVASHLACRIGWRHLLDVTHEEFEFLLYQLPRDMLSGISGVNLVLHVVAGRGGAKLQCGCIFLGMILQSLYLLGFLSCTKYQHSCGQRVERSGMTSLHSLHAFFLRDEITHSRQCPKARHPVRLVEIYVFSFYEIHFFLLVIKKFPYLILH